MVNIRVEYVLNRPIEEVFDAITDHEGYTRFSGFDRAELLEEGQPHRNGVGAVRLLAAGRTRFRERITAFERPVHMGYLVEEMRPIPLRHERGDIRMETVEGGTKVTWISEGRIPIPILGALLGPAAARRGSAAFLGILKQIERS